MTDAIDDPVVLHHMGLVVSNLERSASFYETVFGAETFSRSEEPENGGTDSTDPMPAYSRAMLSLPGGKIELISYQRPQVNDDRPRRIWEIGSGHFGFKVADADLAARELTARGLRTIGSPPPKQRDALSRPTIIFGLDPDGNRIELLQLP
jgi:catechol 2,3-dioxygenase-like lactoylglutathione lyase family enzyme